MRGDSVVLCRSLSFFVILVILRPYVSFGITMDENMLAMVYGFWWLIPALTRDVVVAQASDILD